MIPSRYPVHSDVGREQSSSLKLDFGSNGPTSLEDLPLAYYLCHN
jgi:hypothetical protein